MSVTSDRRCFMRALSRGVAGAGLLPALHTLGCARRSGEDWRPLFDGESLQGWHTNREKNVHGTGGLWEVEDGALTGRQDPPGSGNGGILLTDEKFRDFELSIGIKPDWGVCSGLFLRSTESGQCLQMMVDYHDRGKIGFLYGEGTSGFNCHTFEIHGVLNDRARLVGLRTTPAQSLEEAGVISSCSGEEFVEAYRIDDWNTARVRVTGKDPHVTTWINDLKICEFDGPTTTNEVYAENREEILELIGRPGSIAVQVHLGTSWPVGARCRWKDILIQPL